VQKTEQKQQKTEHHVLAQKFNLSKARIHPKLNFKHQESSITYKTTIIHQFHHKFNTKTLVYGTFPLLENNP